MTWKLILVALSLSACGVVSDADKIAMMEANRAAIIADLFRQQAECQAQAIEFSGDRHVLEACIETYRLSAESAAIVITAIDERITAVRRGKR